MISHASHVPIARSILMYDRRQTTLSLFGIAFSVLIMFMELGFFNGLNDSQALLPPLLNADLVILDAQRTRLEQSNRFHPARLSMATAVEGVAEATALYEGFTTLRNPQTRKIRKIYTLAFTPGVMPLRIPELDRYEEALKTKKTILFDRRSRPIYGHIEPGMEVELETDMRHRVAGLIDIGPNFMWDGYVLMSAGTWKALGNTDDISIGLIRLKPGADPERVRNDMAMQLPDDVTVLTTEQLRRREVNFTTTATPSGIVFGTGLIVGMVIGVVICYQILFNIIFDHLPQYATLKAMGFNTTFLFGIVMRKALLISILGYIPGLLLSILLYAVIEHYTSIIMMLDIGRMSVIFLMTVFMGCVAAAFAVRNVIEADPAELY